MAYGSRDVGIHSTTHITCLKINDMDIVIPW